MTTLVTQQRIPALSASNDDGACWLVQFRDSGERFTQYWMSFIAEFETDFQCLDEQRPNMLAAIRDSCRFFHRWNEAAALANRIHVYLHNRGLWGEIEDILELLLAEAQSVPDTRQWLDLMIHRATIARLRGDHERAVGLYSEVVKLAESAGCHDKLADAYWNWGVLALASGRYRDAEVRLEHCLELCETLPLSPLCIYAKGQLANIEFFRGNLDKAASLLTGVFPLWKELGELDGLIHTTLHQLGRVRAKQRRYGEAEQLLKESLRIKERNTLETQGIAHTLYELGRVELALGKCVEAQGHLQQSLTTSRAIGDHLYTVKAHLALGILHELRKEKDISHKHYSGAVCAIQEGITPPELIAESKFRLGKITIKCGDCIRGLGLVGQSIQALSRSESFLPSVVHQGLTVLRRLILSSR